MFGNFGMGINFGNMNLTSEAIDKKLNDPNTKIEDLLREDELLQEFRSQNQKLIEYFDREKIKRLIDYIIKMPEVDEHEKGYKFPFLCSQIFGLEIDKMLNLFFVTNKQLDEENKKKEENQKMEEKKIESTNNESQQVAPEQKEKESENKDEAKKEPKEGEKKEEEKKEEEKKEEEKKEEEKKEDEKKEEEKKEDEKKEDEKKEEEKKEEEKKEEEKKEEEKKEEEKKEDGNEEEEKEKEEPESKENKMELLDYLFSFLEEENDKKLNYVLCGYFSSLISNLLSLNPTELLKYIYKERSDVLDKMVNHCYRKSISDILSKILHFENYFQSEDSLDKDTRSEMESTRKMTIADIFQKIDINMDNEDLNSIYFLITGLFDPTNILEEKEIFKSLIEERRNMRALLTKQTLFNLDLSKSEEDFEKVENRRKNLMVIIDIILFLLNNIKKLKLELPSNVSDSKLTITHTKLSQEIFDNLNPLIKNLFNKKNEEQRTVLQSFNEYQLKPLGEYKIKIIDLLSHLVPYLKNISKFYDEILIETEFFENAFNYLYEYEWNNIYQESLLSLLKSLINDADNHQLIQEHLFNKLKIIDIIKTHTNSEDKFKFANETISHPISHGYYSFFVSLSYKINTALGGTPIVMTSNTTARQGSFSFIARVPEEGDKKAAMSLLYGGFEDEENNENEAEKEEEKYNYESMKKYINDEWREYFGNISDVIKQYENKDWPEESKKKEEESPFDRGQEDKEEDLLGENNGPSDRERNIFDDNNEDDDDGGRKGIGDEGNKANDDNPFAKGVDTNDFDFGDNKNEIKEENKVGENVFGNSNANDFEFDDDKNKDENKKKDNENEPKTTGEENKNEGAEKEKAGNENKLKEENKPEDKKEEESKKEEGKEEKKEENNGENIKKDENK